MFCYVSFESINAPVHRANVTASCLSLYSTLPHLSQTSSRLTESSLPHTWSFRTTTTAYVTSAAPTSCPLGFVTHGHSQAPEWSFTVVIVLSNIMNQQQCLSLYAKALMISHWHRIWRRSWDRSLVQSAPEHQNYHADQSSSWNSRQRQTLFSSLMWCPTKFSRCQVTFSSWYIIAIWPLAWRP